MSSRWEEKGDDERGENEGERIKGKLSGSRV